MLPSPRSQRKNTRLGPEHLLEFGLVREFGMVCNEKYDEKYKQELYREGIIGNRARREKLTTPSPIQQYQILKPQISKHHNWIGNPHNLIPIGYLSPAGKPEALRGLAKLRGSNCRNSVDFNHTPSLQPTLHIAKP
jgi:hypothetical protein